MKRYYIALLAALFPFALAAQIRIEANASPMERYAAQELQRYHKQLYDQLLPITSEGNSYHYRLATDPSLGEQAYRLNGQGKGIAITGGDSCGVLYGVYGLLEDHLGVRFYFSGDVLPEKAERIASIDDQRTPEMKIRGMLPWTNFPQSATIYSWNDWRYIIDQCAKMRMNFIMIHNYNGFCGHNEMFHNFTYNGYLSRSWMASIRSGHRWACPGWEINEYRFGASEIYPDYDFGADCTLHNETLTNAQVFEKGIVTFRQVIDYAHSRGVKMGLGLDIDVVLPEYCADAAEIGLVDAQIDALTRNYPTLDYLLCFQSESNKDKAFYERWNKIFNRFYTRFKAVAPQTKIAVSGWGVTAESAAELPRDVICAPISHYSASCESGEIYGDLETWGCPWLERDFNSSQYYYPYNMQLSQTIEAYRNRASNMKGFYVLTWRLTDAVSAKMWYVSKAPWWSDELLDSSRKVYYDFALHNYGREAADRVIEIIDQNELFATDFGECQSTPGFNTKVDEYALLNVRDFSMLRDTTATKTLQAVDYAEKQGTQDAATTDGGRCVGFINHGHWLKYPNVEFPDGTNVFSATVASASNGGRITMRLGGVEGKILGSLEVHNTGGWQTWVPVKVRIPETEGKHDLYLCFEGYTTPLGNAETARNQLALLDDCIAKTTDAGQKLRLSHLRARIEGVARHIDLNLHFDSYTWDDLPGAIEPWAQSFLQRIDDISSFGNVMSTQNRFVQENYIRKVEQLRARQQVKAPSHITAKGTADGARITWRNQEPSTRSLRIYRNQTLIATIPASQHTYTDRYNGTASYHVSAVDSDGKESPKGIPATCQAGGSDTEAPIIICTSPLTSAVQHEPLDIRISLVDNRAPEMLSAKVVYRFGNGAWQSRKLDHRTRAVFGSRITAQQPGVLEYYIEASDANTSSRYPATGFHSVAIADAPAAVPATPQATLGQDGFLGWNKVEGAVIYKIYRHRTSNCTPDAASFVAFVPASQLCFKPNGLGFDGAPLSGRYYYTVTAIDTHHLESAPSKKVAVSY